MSASAPARASSCWRADDKYADLASVLRLRHIGHARLRAPLAFRQGGVGHLNIIWTPDSNGYFSTGAEVMYENTEVQNGAKGDATRIQLMAKFVF
jgi:hypothetical protein